MKKIMLVAAAVAVCVAFAGEREDGLYISHVHRGGGKFEEDAFYEECDRLGILVWHDCMFACAIYPSADWFVDQIRAEVEYQVKRLRHHACIALWCGDNELIGTLGWKTHEQSHRERMLVNSALFSSASVVPRYS